MRFFLIGPSIYLFVALMYWVYLKKSNNILLMLFKFPGWNRKSALSSDIYNLPGSPFLCAIWQFLLEICPLIFLFAVLINFMLLINIYTSHAVLFVFLTFIPLTIHTFIFGIKFSIKELESNWRIIFLILAFGILTLTFESDLIKPQHSGNLYYFFFVIYLLEVFLLGRTILTFTILKTLEAIVLGPLVIIIWINKKKLRDNVKEWLMIVKFQWFYPLDGYIGYIRNKYYFIRNIRP